MKFLIPFSLLISLGSQFEWRAAPAIAQAQISSLMGEISQPFAAPPPAPLLAAVPQAPSQIPTVLFGIWLCGFALGAFCWPRAWLRIRAAVRTASPLQADQPIGRTSIRVMGSPALLEPCVFGIFRPVLLLPDGIRERLTPRQLETIFMHELCHVRRRDNLAAAVHMVVETLFWFYPPAYWIGKRLMDERETACDEEVLRVIGSPEVYANGILAVCRFCLQPSPVLAAGVTGSNLKKRIEGIMGYRAALKLGFSRKLLLALAAITAFAGPIAIGVVNATAIRAQSEPAVRPAFEVASVKLYKDDGVGPRNSHTSYSPQGVDFGGRSLGFIIGEAYNFTGGRIVGPGSLTKEAVWGSLAQGYDIVAKADHAVPKDQLRLMLQSLLAERFKLKVHWEAKTDPVYRLAVANGGPKLEESQETEGTFAMSCGPDEIVFRNAEMMRLSGFLSGQVDRIVVDQTGLKGLYNFSLKRPGDTLQDPRAKPEGRSPDSPSAGTFADALKHLGLQLIAGTAPVDYLVVDHIERPSEN